MSDIIERALEHISSSILPYDADKFDKIKPISAFCNIQIPSHPGQRTSTRSISEHVESGDLSIQDGKKSYQINRTSIQDALNILFPDDILAEYLTKSLEEFNFLENDTNTRQYNNSKFVPIVSKEYSEPVRTDEIIIINRDNDNIDSSFADGSLNKNMHNSDLIRAYKFLIDNPEYGLGIKWLAGIITDYAKELKYEIENNPEFTQIKSSGILETLDLIAHPNAEALMDNRLVLAISSAISYDQNNSENTKKQIKSISKPNIFKYERENPDGNKYTGMCPAARFIMDCLTKDIDGEIAVVKFINKIKDARSNSNPDSNQREYIDKECVRYSQLIETTLDNPEAKKASEGMKSKAKGCPFKH